MVVICAGNTCYSASIDLDYYYMDEAQLLSDKVGIIDYGKIVMEGTPRELIEQMGADVIHIEGQGNSKVFVESLNALPFTQTISAVNKFIQVGVDSGDRRPVKIVTVAGVKGFRIEDISVAKPSLGDVFLNYTGRQFRD